jgi:hypothetical protein
LTTAQGHLCGIDEALDTHIKFNCKTINFFMDVPIISLTMSDILACVQILQNPVTDDNIRINDVADNFQLFAPGMVCYFRHQGHLFLPFFAHFVFGSFSKFVVILVVWSLSIYYNKKKNTIAKCAFFMNYG